MSRCRSPRSTLFPGLVFPILFTLLATPLPAGAVDFSRLENDQLGTHSDELIEAAREAVRRDPSDRAAHARLAKYLVRRYSDRVDPSLKAEAEASIARALGSGRPHARAKAWQALITCVDAREAEDKARGREGLNQLDAALALDPEDLTLLYTDATVSIEAPKSWGRLDQAAERMHEVEKRIETSPEVARTYDIDVQKVYYKLGKVYQERKDYPRAVTYWKKAVEVNPQSKAGRKSQRSVERYSGQGSDRPLWRPGG